MISDNKSITDKLFHGLAQASWGSYSITSLYLSLLSGVLVALQYAPATPYYSAASLDTVVPFGVFWRSLHFYSSQLFFLCACCHFLFLFLLKRHHRIPLSRWIALVLSLFVLILILFTGYVLRGDVTGSFAGTIAENILRSIPIIGNSINALLFSVESMGMTRVYPNHVAALCLLWLFLSWSHIRHYTISWSTNLFLSIPIVLFCIWMPAPLDPERLGVFKVNGPWFFLGLQEGLRLAPPLWAGVVFPSLFCGALCLMNRGGELEKRAAWFAFFWLILYGILTAISLI